MIIEQRADRTQLSNQRSVPVRAAAERPETSIIVPAYNEEMGLPLVLRKLLGVIDASCEIIVVDDGSVDDTALVAGRYPCRLVRHPANLGKGAAMKSGVEAARGDKIIFIDADDQHPADLVPQLAYALDWYDMAVASRTHGSENLSIFHRLGNILFRNLIHHLYNYQPHDPLTGLIGIRRDHILKMNLESTGFGVEAEIAIKSASMGLNVLDIPIRHRPRIGKPKLRGLQDGYGILLTILKMLALYNPNITFTIPGVLMFVVGIAMMATLMANEVNIYEIGLGIHSFVLAAMLALAGFQIATFGFAMKAYALAYKFTRHDLISRLVMRDHMAKMVFSVGAVLFLTAFALGIWVGVQWVQNHPLPLDRSKGLVLFSFLVVLGLNTAVSAAFLSVFLRELYRAERVRGTVTGQDAVTARRA